MDRRDIPNLRLRSQGKSRLPCGGSWTTTSISPTGERKARLDFNGSAAPRKPPSAEGLLDPVRNPARSCGTSDVARGTEPYRPFGSPPSLHQRSPSSRRLSKSGRPPALIGVLIEDQFEQVVLNSELELAATARGCRLRSFQAEAERIARLAENENRVVVAYSQVERHLFSNRGGVDLGTR